MNRSALSNQDLGGIALQIRMGFAVIPSGLQGRSLSGRPDAGRSPARLLKNRLAAPRAGPLACPRSMLSWNEIRHRAIGFSRDKTSEKSESQSFWNDLFRIFGRCQRF
jgi:hypothetical protein